MRYLEIQTIWDKDGNSILNRANHHQELTFNVNHKKGFSKCYLFEDQAEDRIHILSTGACIKAIYTDADYAEGERLANELPLNHGDIIAIRAKYGKRYKVHVNGNYSDLGELIPTN